MVPSKALLEKYSLTEEQCMRRFPGLLEGLEEVLLIDENEGGVVRSVEGRIREGELWVAPEKVESGVSYNFINEGYGVVLTRVGADAGVRK